MPKHKSWDHAYLAPLIGGRIVGTGVSNDGFPILTVENEGKTYRLEVSQDPEGNGARHTVHRFHILGNSDVPPVRCYGISEGDEGDVVWSIMGVMMLVNTIVYLGVAL